MFHSFKIIQKHFTPVKDVHIWSEFENIGILEEDEEYINLVSERNQHFRC